MAYREMEYAGGCETPATQPTNETGGGGTIYIQKSGHVVQLMLNGQFNNLVTGTYITICTLPEGFRPKHTFYNEGISFSSTPSGKSFKYIYYVASNGNVAVNIIYSDSTSAPTSNVYIVSNTTFLTD